MRLRITNLAWFISSLLIILGSKLALINSYGSDLPFYDQWDAEPEALYISYDRGTLAWGSLFSAFSEHRILFSRLLALGLFSVTHHWDSRFIIIASAFIHSLTGFFLIWCFWKLNEKKELGFISGIIILIFAVPFSWENILTGLNCTHYFLIGFSIAAIFLIPKGKPFSPAWLLGAICAIFAIFDLGSGFSAAFVCLLIVIFKMYSEKKWDKYQLISGAVCLIIAVYGAWLLQRPEVHSTLQAHSISDFIVFLGKALSWPWVDVSFLFPLLWLPFVIFVIKMVKREFHSDLSFFLFGLGIWILIQTTAMAFARGTQGMSPASKYMDVLSLNLPVNILSLYFLLRNRLQDRIWRGLMAGLLALFSVGIINLVINDSVVGISVKHHYNQIEVKNVREYLRTGDYSILENAKRLEIPYPDPKRLADLLKNEEIRKMLPASVNPVANDNFYSRGAKSFASAGKTLLIVGLLIFVFLIVRSALVLPVTAPLAGRSRQARD